MAVTDQDDDVSQGVGLDNVGELLRIPASGGREPAPAAEGRADGKPATHGGRMHRFPVRETGSERQPSLLAVEARQRRPCRCIERLPAALALILVQDSRLAARNGAGSAEMRPPAVRAQARPGFPALRGAELFNLGESSLDLLVIHHL